MVKEIYLVETVDLRQWWCWLRKPSRHRWRMMLDAISWRIGHVVMALHLPLHRLPPVVVPVALTKTIQLVGSDALR